MYPWQEVLCPTPLCKNGEKLARVCFLLHSRQKWHSQGLRMVLIAKKYSKVCEKTICAEKMCNWIQLICIWEIWCLTQWWPGAKIGDFKDFLPFFSQDQLLHSEEINFMIEKSFYFTCKSYLEDSAEDLVHQSPTSRSSDRTSCLCAEQIQASKTVVGPEKCLFWLSGAP